MQSTTNDAVATVSQPASVETCVTGVSAPRRRSQDLELLALKLERSIRKHTGDRVRQLHVEVDDEVVVLRGRCGTYYCKQLAQTAVRSMLGKRSLRNQIEVW
jgi:osmotically-inducible protein OsmY